MSDAPRRVAIVGGGMAGLAAAWRLTRPDGPAAEVTVYQRGWRLGGKGASSRGPNGRIEEHGLHLWLGYYDNAFRLLRQVYDELDRKRSDAGCPIATVRDAFVPATTIGSWDGASPWSATFPTNGRVPGEGDGDWTLSVTDFVTRATSLLGTLGASLGSTAPARQPVLSASPRPPRPRGALGGMLTGAASAFRDPAAVRRLGGFVELQLVMLRGIVADDLMARGYAAIDDLDFRDWLTAHGATASVTDGPVVRGLYDLVFGYEHGDRSRPRFAAGTGLFLAGLLFFHYRGAMFWKMTAGMGDVVFAPLYEALRRRGVRFEFFHRLDDLHVADDGRSIGAISFGRQVATRNDAAYDPLVRVGGLPVFPAAPDADQLVGDVGPEHQRLEIHGCAVPDAGRVTLEAGRDFDVAVLAVSLGMVPHVCGELVARATPWRQMVDNLGTVATQSAQLWLDPDERTLGAPHPGAVLSPCGEPFDTVASVSHSVSREAWPGAAPQTSISMCSVLADDATDGVVAANVDRFLDETAHRLWPRFDRRHVRGDVYARANTDPSDRYVQSLPGTGRFRLRADGSGFANLVLAGDWVDTGLNAGCIEAATLAGLQAANAVEGRDLTEGTTGFRPLQGAPG